MLELRAPISFTSVFMTVNTWERNFGILSGCKVCGDGVYEFNQWSRKKTNSYLQLLQLPLHHIIIISTHEASLCSILWKDIFLLVGPLIGELAVKQSSWVMLYTSNVEIPRIYHSRFTICWLHWIWSILEICINACKLKRRPRLHF